MRMIAYQSTRHVGRHRGMLPVVLACPHDGGLHCRCRSAPEADCLHAAISPSLAIFGPRRSRLALRNGCWSCAAKRPTSSSPNSIASTST